MIVKPSEVIDIEDIIVDIFDTILEYDSGQITQDLALKKSLNIIEGLKRLNKSMYQEIKLDLINTIKDNNT